MIVIDMDMPTKCMNCQLLGRDTMYCQVYPRKDLNLIKVANGKPDWCPIKCDIEDIKAEISKQAWAIAISDTSRANGMWDAYRVIDKYREEQTDAT